MRRFLLAAVISERHGAQAADMPDFLRGTFTAPVAPPNWQGYYVGGQAELRRRQHGFHQFRPGPAGKNFSTTSTSSKSSTYRSWPLQQRTRTQNTGSAGSSATTGSGTTSSLGVEANYIHGKFNGESSGVQGRAVLSLSDRTIHRRSPTLIRAAAMQVTDHGDRSAVRGGYALGCFLPYVFGGVALGQRRHQRSVQRRTICTTIMSARRFHPLPDHGMVFG